MRLVFRVYVCDVPVCDVTSFDFCQVKPGALVSLEKIENVFEMLAIICTIQSLHSRPIPHNTFV